MTSPATRLLRPTTGRHSTKNLRPLEVLQRSLTAINIDDAFISKPFPTEHRALLMTWSQSAVERWFAARDASWPLGKEQTAQDLFDDFNVWAEQHDRRARDHVSNVVIFGKEMMKLEPSGYIEKGKSSSSFY